MLRIKICLLGLGMVVKCIYPNDRDVVRRYCENYSVKETGYNRKLKRKTVTTLFPYTTENGSGDEFGILRVDYEGLLKYLHENGIYKNSIEITEYKPKKGQPFKAKLKKGAAPRNEEQIKCVDFITVPDAPLRMVGMATGHGKTGCSLMSLPRIKERVALVMSSGLFDPWMKTDWALDLDWQKDAVTIRGQTALQDAVNLARAGRYNFDITFISTKTIQDHLNSWLRNDECKVDCPPHLLFETLGIGVRVIDEAHEFLAANVLMTIHYPVHRSLYLTASLGNKDPLIQTIYKKLFPVDQRFKDTVNNDHVSSYSIYFSLDQNHKQNFKGPKGYSHVKFEDWLVSNTKVFNAYVDMIYKILNKFYLEPYKPKQKALLFCAKVDFGILLCEALRKRLDANGHKDKTMDTFTASKPITCLHEPDIVVTTPGSAGTGKDVKNVKMALSCVAIGSPNKNLQMVGRPRPMIDYPDIDPIYSWLTAVNVERQLHYDKCKRMEFMDHVKEIIIVRTGITI